MSSDTLVRKVMLQLQADDGDTEAKIDALAAKGKELKEKWPELEQRIDTAVASAKVAVLRDELKEMGKPVDVPVTVADDPAKAKIAELQLKLDKLRLEKQDIKLGADAGPAEVKIAGLMAQIKALSEEGGKESGSAFGGGFALMSPQVIVPAVTLALAGLPALAATAGAGAGVALGAALLVGTSSVKGPLYSQFHELTSGLVGEVRTAALPLVGPLAQAFAELGAFAKQLKPELTSVFSALGPDVQPLTRMLEGLVSGPLSGFAALMKASEPAVEIVSKGITDLGNDFGKLESNLVPGVKSSAEVLTGLFDIVGDLMPVVGTLSSDLAKLLAPIISDLGSKDVPELTNALNGVLTEIQPLLPEIGTLADDMLQLGTGPMLGLIGTSVQLADTVSNVLIPPLTVLVGWIDDVANAAVSATNLLSKLPGMGGLAAGAGSGFSIGAGIAPGLIGMVGSALTPGSGNYGDPDFAAWSGGVTGTPAKPSSSSSGSAGPTQAQQQAAQALGSRITAALGSGIRETLPQAEAQASKLAQAVHTALLKGQITQSEADSLVSAIDKQLQSRAERIEAAGQKLGQALGASMVRQLASSGSSSAAQSAVAKLLTDIQTALAAGLVTQAQAAELTRQVDVEGAALEKIATRAEQVNARIATAKAFAASTASSVEGNYALSGFATSGQGGRQASAGQIITSLHGDLIQVKQFTANIKKLAREGLDKNYLAQLIAMGPVQGGPLAQELAGTALSDITSINKYEYQIGSASGSLGKLAADQMYDSGKQAGKGFLSGLEAQKQAIDKVMAGAARAMVAELRKELGIGANGKLAASKVEIDIRGGDKEFRIWLKKIIRTTGGNVSVIGA